MTHRAEKGSLKDSIHKILSAKEADFFYDWINGHEELYKPTYKRTLKHRIRMKYFAAKRFVYQMETNGLDK